jgi:hypothetical protein
VSDVEHSYFFALHPCGKKCNRASIEIAKLKLPALISAQYINQIGEDIFIRATAIAH